MRGEVGGRFPLHAADVGGRRDRRSGCWEMASRERLRRVGSSRRTRHDVYMVQEDPEDFLADVADLLLPDLVGSGTGHLGDEAGGCFLFRRGRVAEVGEESTSARREGGGRRGGEVGE